MFLKTILLLATSMFTISAPLTFEGTEGPGKGKHIVFIANDHEYRSEETCPLIAKILAKHHGFKCTVLFGIDENGHIKGGGTPIPDMEVLKEADLLFFYTRFMTLPDEQADALVAYFERGGPTIGLRTSTHCFNGQKGKWAKLNFNYGGDDYRGGLGEQIYGNTWNKGRGQSHYGSNHKMGSTISGIGKHAILTGVQPMHTYSGAYKSQPPADATPLLEVQVLNTFGPSKDVNKDRPLVNAGWTRDAYIAPSGAKKTARVVYTSFGASEDVLDENARRFLINASFWAIGLEDKIEADLDASIVGKFQPAPYTTGSFYRVGVKPSDLAGWDSQVMPSNAKYAGFENGANPRLLNTLKFRPNILKEIQKVHPDFDLNKAQPKKK
ncbi:MAG: hypothetical protein ACJA1W_002259 [Akkermansiaceae bacterium]|jgi:hypothetical protein